MAQKYKTYQIHCANCNEYILTYKKVGAGKGILRLYHANIQKPENLTNLFIRNTNIKEVSNLGCPKCETIQSSVRYVEPVLH